MSYTIKHDAGSDSKTILDPAGWELITIQDLHRELNELLARAESAEKMADHWENKAGVKLLTPSIDWQRVRTDAAIAAMQGMLACPESSPDIIKWSLYHADALTAKLKKEVAE